MAGPGKTMFDRYVVDADRDTVGVIGRLFGDEQVEFALYGRGGRLAARFANLDEFDEFIHLLIDARNETRPSHHLDGCCNPYCKGCSTNWPELVI